MRPVASNGAAERGQEHHALPFCVRGEELRDLVVEEGESGGAETKGVGGEVEAAADDSSLELGGPIAAITEAGEDRLEIREAVDVRRGSGRKLLEEAESARDRPKLAFLEELERPFCAPEVPSREKCESSASRTCACKRAKGARRGVELLARKLRRPIRKGFSRAGSLLPPTNATPSRLKDFGTTGPANQCHPLPPERFRDDGSHLRDRLRASKGS